MWRQQKKIGELRGDIQAISQVLTSSFKKPQTSPPKKNRTVQAEDAIDGAAFKPGFQIVKL
jgi:hypothetical protein